MPTAVAALAVVATWEVSAASAQDCEALWVERNTYYKHAGCCFRTTRAIQHFGNSGCNIDNEARIRFPPHTRRRIDEILRLERVRGCPH
jgi:trimethylamine:corrinoid methyltransferase-like protein